MIFYADNFKRIRKQKNLSMEIVAQKAGIVRKTLSFWENKKRIPSETKIRTLANVLNISVNDISDIEPEHPVSENMLSNVVESWLSLADLSEQDCSRQEKELIHQILNQQAKIRQASVIIKAFISSMQLIFYIKDTNLKYITASSAFLKNLSLNSGYRVLGKTDRDFFPINEARQNHDQDYNVLLSGKSIIKQEDYIIGSRKKKWGLINKTPIFDIDGKITGVMGSFVDITDRKREEKRRYELDRIKTLLEYSLNSISDAYTIYSVRNHKYIFVNNAKSKIFGYPLNNFYNDPFFRVNNCIHPEFIDIEKKYNVTHSWPSFREYKCITPDGKTKWIEATVTKKDFNGESFMVSIERDITQQKKRKEKSASTETIKIALKMKNEGIASEIIARCTGLSSQSILSL